MQNQILLDHTNSLLVLIIVYTFTTLEKQSHHRDRSKTFQSPQKTQNSR
jgi:hypothetical protein